VSAIISIPVKSILKDSKPVISINDQSGFVSDNPITGTTETPIIIFGILIAFVLFLWIIPVPINPDPCIIINRKISKNELDDVSVKNNFTKSPTPIPIIPMPMSIDLVVLDSLFKIPFNMLMMLITRIAIPGYVAKKGDGFVILKKR